MGNASVWKGILYMLGADLAFAVMASAAKFTGHHVPASQVVFVRSLAGTLFLLSVLKAKKIPLAGKEPRLLLLRGVVGYIAMQCYFWALPQLDLGTAVMLNYTAPIFAVLTSFIFLAEQPSFSGGISVLVSFGGVFLLTAPQLSGKPLPILAGLVSGILAGSVHAMIRQSNRNDHPLLIIFYFTLASTVGSGLLMLKSGSVIPSMPEWSGMALITVSSLLGQLCLTLSLKDAPVWTISPFGYVTPVLGAFLGWWLWKEIPAPGFLAGSGIIILSGTVLALSLRSARPLPLQSASKGPQNP